MARHPENVQVYINKECMRKAVFAKCKPWEERPDRDAAPQSVKATYPKARAEHPDSILLEKFRGTATIDIACRAFGKAPDWPVAVTVRHDEKAYCVKLETLREAGITIGGGWRLEYVTTAIAARNEGIEIYGDAWGK